VPVISPSITTNTKNKNISHNNNSHSPEDGIGTNTRNAEHIKTKNTVQNISITAYGL
jgi:hypothetical protein